MKKVLGIMTLGFILISTVLTIKYKPTYEVKLEGKTIGYVSNIRAFKNTIEENLKGIIKNEKNIESISLKEEPKYEMNLMIRTAKTDEEEVLETLKQDVVKTYKFYSVTLNGKNAAYVDTLEEAEEVVEKIKKENEGNDLELDLAINEKYTEKLEEVKTDKIEVAENSLENEIEKLLEKEEAKKAIAAVHGINISVLPVSGRISSRFGVSSSIRSGAHTGLDIACSAGTNIKAVARGKVVFAERNGAYGNLVKIDHGNGVETWYAHCSSILTKVGAKIKPGDVIATVGSTGNSTGPHLHLEIRVNGTAINPQLYLYK